MVPRAGHTRSGPQGLRPGERKMDAPAVKETEKEMKERRVRSFKIREEPVDPKDADGKTDVKRLRIDRIRANPGDTIRWEVDDKHKISIWFPHAGVFVTPVIAVMHEGSVEATIRDDAPNGNPVVYEYAIYDHDKQKFVTCESHPKIEIPKSGA